MAERILLVGLNWIGDAVMSMPAVQACREENPDAHLSMLVKSYLKPLWEMHAAPDEILCLNGVWPTVQELRFHHFDRALVLPNSFRSAYLPMLAGIPRRIGLKGDWRSLMLNQIIPLSGGHQSNEYFPILAPSHSTQAHELPALSIPDSAFESLSHKLGGLTDYAVFMPGAARGASKMWPTHHFQALAERFLAEYQIPIVFAGGSGDAEACEMLAGKLGEGAISVAGKTNLKEWAALLSHAKVAAANDSGGMHLAGAVGAPVVGIYGITDPEKTGPLARSFRIVQNSSVKARDIARNSNEARNALESIPPDQVMDAIRDLLNK